MDKELWKDLTDIAPLLIFSSLMASYLKGVKGLTEYFKSTIASLLVGIPASFITEFLITSPNAWLIKYTIVLISGSFGICIFNGIFKIFKGFEENPIDTIKKVKKIKEDTQKGEFNDEIQ